MKLLKTFLFCFLLPYPTLLIYIVLFFCTERSDGTCETWACFLVCVCTSKTNFLNWETEKDTKLSKLASLSVRAVMSSKQSFIFN